MTFRAVPRSDRPAGYAPVRLVDGEGREIEWANQFLDAQCVRGLQPLSLRAYAHTLLHCLRWWSCRPGVEVTRPDAGQFTESTLIDYVRDQLGERPQPAPETINGRCSLLRRWFRFHFHADLPEAPYLIRRVGWRPSPLGYGRACRTVTAGLRLRAPERVVVPLSPEQVGRFWASFRSARDLAMVALMLLNGLRSCEVLALRWEDLLWSESQIRVTGKGRRVRLLPLPPETIRILQCYVRNERPSSPAPEVFLSRKGRARGHALTPAGLRSLFRHHRAATSVPQANPHRFRHTFGSDMIRAGVSLPALMRLMGHAHIQTTLRYVQLTPQDVFAEFARAVAAHAEPPA